MSNDNNAVDTQAQEPTVVDVVAMIAALEPLDVADKQQMHVKNVAEKLNEIIAVVKQLQVSNSSAAAPVRDRGPKSDRDMTEADARAIMLGELKDVSHKEAAEKLGLSYGQVYSARKGFTFKPIYKEMLAAQAAPKAETTAAQ